MLEILATIATVVCVLLANFRSTWQYPVGIIGTILFGYVVYDAQLYANFGLQVFFTFVQFYGWYYWLWGNKGTKPNITTFEPDIITISLATLSLSIAGSVVLNHYTNANMALLDAIIFGLSVLAQFLLDRKKIESWTVWGIVNVLSIWLYASQELWVFTGLYVGLLINCFIGYRMWNNELQYKKNYGLSAR